MNEDHEQVGSKDIINDTGLCNVKENIFWLEFGIAMISMYIFWNHI